MFAEKSFFAIRTYLEALTGPIMLLKENQPAEGIALMSSGLA